MIKASLDTSNFSFEAYGTSAGHAMKALERGLDLHGEQYKLAADWWHPLRGDIATTYFAQCQCYRDGEQLK